MTAFEEMGIMPEIGKAIEEIEWNLPTNIQSEAIPLILGGGDVLMAAETGSGKTGAFSLPVLQIVWESLHLKTKVIEDVHADKWVFSALDLDPNLSLTPDCLSAQSKTQNWQGVRANKAVKKVCSFFSGVSCSFQRSFNVCFCFRIVPNPTDFIMKFILLSLVWLVLDGHSRMPHLNLVVIVLAGVLVERRRKVLAKTLKIMVRSLEINLM